MTRDIRRARWSRSSLIALAALVLAPLGACSRAAPPLPSVILVSVDTLRADRLSCYGYARPTSPHVDSRIAARGVRFTDATSPSNNTSCSFASIHTGAYVRTHGVVSLAPLGFVLPERFETLAEALRGMGYKTAAAVSAAHLNAAISGLGQGFEVYADHGGAEPKRRAADTNAALFPALRDLLRKRDEPGADPAPLFLWVHYFDPHWPYEPEAEDLRALPLPAGSSTAPLPDLKPGLAGDPEDNDEIRARHAEMSARYDGEVHESDRGVGELLDFLEIEKVLPNAIVVFTSDHGENLGEHGLFFNHARLFEPVIRVPLLVSAPGIEPRVVTEMVHTIDIYPTVLDLLNASPRAPAHLEGESLGSLLRGQRGPARDAVFSESGNWRDKAVKTLSGEKLVLPPGLFGSEMFDLRSDPGETTDVAAQRADRRAALEARIATFAGPVRWRFRLVAPEDASATARIAVALEATGGGPAEPRDLSLAAMPGGTAEDGVTARFGGLFLRGMDAATLDAATLGFRPFLDHLVSVVVEDGASDGAPVVIRREPIDVGGGGGAGETIRIDLEPTGADTLKLRLGTAGRFSLDVAAPEGIAAAVVEDGRRLRVTGAIAARTTIRVAVRPAGSLVLADGVLGLRRLAPKEIAAGPPGETPVLYVSPTLLAAEATADDERMKGLLSKPGVHVWREPGSHRLHRDAPDLDPGERKRLQGLGYLGGPNR